MTEYLLPGDIKGLLQRGSVVVYPVSVRIRTPGRVGLVIGHGIDVDAIFVAGLNSGDTPSWWPPGEVHLDLRDPTSRAHAAWWAMEHPSVEGFSFEENDAIRRACLHFTMDGAQIQTLRALVLRLAGRA